MKTRPVILCGGSGTKLWSESRENFPKQFIPIKDGYNFFDLTLKKLNLIKNLLTPIIITNKKYKLFVKNFLENLFVGKNLKIKNITVNPKSKLSKQFRYFRSEHWFISQGKGSIFLDGKIQILKKEKSIDIPKKSIHYIESQTDKILTFIKIQMGTYFGKDDIERIDDFYGRK